MLVKTTRFGPIEIEQDRVVIFPHGLIGFADYKRFVLWKTSPSSPATWLQSLDDPALAWAVTTPEAFTARYAVPWQNDSVRNLGIEHADDADVFIVLSKHGRMLTGNLKGPLVIHRTRRLGEQLIISDRRLSTRTPLSEWNRQPSALSA